MKDPFILLDGSMYVLVFFLSILRVLGNIRAQIILKRTISPMLICMSLAIVARTGLTYV